MQNHPVTTPDTSPSVTALVFVGPPASGKSTLRALCEDAGAVGCDLEQFHEHGAVAYDGYRDAIASTVEKATRTSLQVCCIEGAVIDDEVAAVREEASETLVIRVRVTDTADRMARYIRRELNTTTNEAIAESDRDVARNYGFAREAVEQPYPEHDVSIHNSDETQTSELLARIRRLLTVVGNSDCTLVAPDTVDVGEDTTAESPDPSETRTAVSDIASNAARSVYEDKQ